MGWHCHVSIEETSKLFNPRISSIDTVATLQQVFERLCLPDHVTACAWDTGEVSPNHTAIMGRFVGTQGLLERART
jgi:hypothetical protein